ncbi:croquemort [Carabus blaptoides fortunei]
MFSDKGTKFAFFKETKGVGDLSKKDIVELKEMLDRQNNLLANKSLINKLNDKGEKIQKVRDQISEEIRRRGISNSALDRERTVNNSTVWEWREQQKASKAHASDNVQSEEKDVLKILSQNGEVASNRQCKSHMQRLIDKEKDPNFTFKPFNPMVADKIKKVIPDAHTEPKSPITVKPLHLDESLELLTEQISALKILSKASRRKRVEECIEDRLNESPGEIVEEELEDTTTDETETKSKVIVALQNQNHGLLRENKVLLAIRYRNRQLALHESSYGYDIWKETPIPMYMDVYLFNWTNPEEVKKDWTIKPIVEQLGPYVFSEKHTRVNITWNSNYTVSFRQIRTWHHRPDLSVGSLDDKVNSINTIAATIAYTLRNKHYIVKKAVDFFMRETKTDVYVSKTARELLFEGYDDKMLDLVEKLNISINVPFKKFGWFVNRNESYTYDGLFNLYTGTDEFQKLGMLDRWNTYKQTPFYPDSCGQVHGTTGELWPPVPDNQSVTMFSSDMCSTVTLDYDGEMEIHGVEGRRFTGQNRTFDNGQLYPEQSCYGIGEVVPSGMRNVSSCKFGSPAFLTFPHFYLADKSVADRVQGLAPNKSIHELFLEIEPNTGIPLRARPRVQVNILIQPIKGFSMYEKAVTTFMPAFWFENRVELTSDYASQVKLVLVLPHLGVYTGAGFGGIGLLLLLTTAVLTYHKSWKGTEDADLQN